MAPQTTLYAGTDCHDKRLTQAGATVNGFDKIYCRARINFRGEVPVGLAPIERGSAAGVSHKDRNRVSPKLPGLL
ncbi:MAG: hypothetical protein MUC60_05300 [Oscillatoria sp. Prado101]|nr:hypothetical protein [Oscillatoria sp. Prado101]